jgi:hypothetical protein
VTRAPPEAWDSDVSQANVITLHAFDDDEALGWLGERLGQRNEWSVAELARQFGWPRAKLRRRLASWTKAGRIAHHAARKGKVIIEPVLDQATPAGDDAGSRLAALRLVTRALANDAPTTAVEPPSRSMAVTIGAAVLFATAVGLTGVGLVMNARFAASFGRTIEAAVLLALIGLAIDVLAVMLPAAAVHLWHRRAIGAAVTAWTIWVAALAMTLLAATGFASTQIGDAVAGRAKLAGERSALAQRIDRLRLERASIAELRTVTAIEVELQRAQPGAQAVWRITAGCRDVTRANSARACAEVLELREAIAVARRRDVIDAELRQGEARLAALPAIAAADPQAKTAAEIVTWLSAGRISPTQQDISWVRTIGLALTPSLAGLIGMLALSLVGPRRGRARAGASPRWPARWG